MMLLKPPHEATATNLKVTRVRTVWQTTCLQLRFHGRDGDTDRTTAEMIDSRECFEFVVCAVASQRRTIPSMRWGCTVLSVLSIFHFGFLSFVCAQQTD